MAPSPIRGPRRSRSRNGWRRGLLRSEAGLTDRNSKVEGRRGSNPSPVYRGGQGGAARGARRRELLTQRMADATSPGLQNHVVVLGAGPAGLSGAAELTRHGAPVTGVVE